MFVQRLRIAVVAHPRHPVAAPFAGGMEVFTWRLTHALMARGHAVTLFASGDSDGALPLSASFPVHYDAVWPGERWRDTDALHGWLDARWPAVVDRIEAGGFDVVHNNALHPEPIRRAVISGQPMVTTLHVPPFHTLAQAVSGAAGPALRFACPSHAMVGLWGGPRHDMVVAPNGIDLTLWAYGDGRGDAVWFGRIAPNKGAAEALAAAHRADAALDLYGPVEDRAYFQTAVSSLLDARRRYGGHLGQAALATRVAQARVALFTPLWDEPFGLAAVEAMACGTPIAAFASGAAREVVGAAGCFAAPRDVAGLSVAMARAARLDRRAVRRRAVERFAEAVMLDAYEQLYREVMAADPRPRNVV